MEKLNQYFALQKEIYDYFGYVEDWVVIPLDDSTCYFWRLDGDEVVYGPDPVFFDDFETPDAEWYSAPIYHQRFLPKWVYPAEDYTLICVDTQCDGNKFLMVFDNTKEVK